MPVGAVRSALRYTDYSIGVCPMQSRVIQLAEKIVETLRSENRNEAIDALDIARVLLRKNAISEAVCSQSLEAQQVSPVEA